MKNNIPDWFNQKEFDSFLSERYNIHSQRAEQRAQRLFFDTKRMIQKIMGETPPNELARAHQDKAAMKLRRDRRIAQIRANADVLDGKEAASRMSIPQKLNNSFDLDQAYVDFLTEAAKKGSDRDFNTGTKSSANERASERNLTGDPKVQAREKKREQRKDDRSRPKPNSRPNDKRKPVKIGTKKKGGVLAKGSAKDASKFIGVKIKSGKEKGAVEIIPRDEYREEIHQILVGSKDEDGKKATKGELTQLASEDTFQRTKSSDFLGISRPDEKKEKEDAKGKPESRRGAARTRKSAQGKQKTKTERKTGRKDEPSSTQAQMIQGLGQPLPVKPKPVAGAKLAVPAFSGDMIDVPATIGEKAAMISTLTRDHPANSLIEKLFSKTRTKASKRLKKLQEELDQYPQLAMIGEQQITMMVSDIIQRNPAFAKFAQGMDESDISTEFVAVNSSLMRQCIEPSKFFKDMGVSDTSPKTDVFVFPTKHAESIISKVMSGDCNFSEEEKELIDGYSFKQGKYAAIASSQEIESAAVLEAVTQKIEALLNDPRTRKAMENALFTGGGQDGQYLVKLREMIQILKDMGELMKKKVYFTGRDVKYGDLKDPMTGQMLAMKDPAAAAFNQQIDAKLQKLNEVAKDIINNPIIQALIVHEQLSGNFKFSSNKKETSVIQGKAVSVLLLNEKGMPITSMAIPDVEQLLQGPTSEDPVVKRFFEFSRQQLIRGSVKRRTSMRGTFFNPVMRSSPERKQTQQQVTDSFNLFNNQLDTLFESEFQPADINIIGTVSQVLPDNMRDIIGDIDSDDDDTQQQEEEFVPFDGMTPEEYAKAVNYNFFRILQGAGYQFTEMSIPPFNAEELGIRLASMDSNVSTFVSYNGREFNIPVLNQSIMQEELINEYHRINDMCVQMIKDGHDPKEIMIMFENETKNLLTERNYKREYALYHGKPEQRAERSKRVLARRKMIKRHGKKALRGKDVDHKDGNPKNNGDSNLRLRSINSNRSDNGHRKEEIKEATSKPNWWNKLTGSWEHTQFLMNAVPGQNLIDKRLKDLLSKNKGQSR